MREFDPYTYDFWIEVDTVAIINITEIVKRLSLNKEGLAKKRKIIGKAKYNDQWSIRIWFRCNILSF
jgi:hypothetical protein